MCLLTGSTITSHIEGHFSPPFVVEVPWHSCNYPLTKHTSLTFRRHHHITLLCWKLEPRKIFKDLEIRSLYHMGLLHQMVWHPIMISYQGDPWNVDGSNTINIFGTRRRVNIILWMKNPSTPSFHITVIAPPILIFMKLVTLLNLGLKLKFLRISFRPSAL